MALSRREVLAGAASLAGLSVREQEPIHLRAGEHLFVDDYLIARQSAVKRVINSPQRLPDPIVTGKEDGCFQPYLSVIREERDRFRMWYDVAVDGQTHIGHIESLDGIHWRRPHRVLNDASRIGYGASVLDEGPEFADASRRYKLAWWHDGLRVAFSPDGFTWRDAAPRPVLTGISDIVFLARDPIRKRYILTCKVDSTPADGYKGKTPNAPEGYRRCVGQSVSNDCVNWTPARRIIKPDDQDQGITEFYSIGGVIERGGLLIGLLKVLRDDLPHDAGAEPRGIGYTALAWSRDGETWQRDRQPFLDRNPIPGSWDRAMTWGDYQLLVGDETYIYYGGYARGHKVERYTERQIGLGRMKRDRYVARAAGRESGSLATPPVLLPSSALKVNAEIRGELRIKVLNSAGKQVAESSPISGDSTSHQARWNRAVDLRGRPVTLEFQLHDARLFGFETA